MKKYLKRTLPIILLIISLPLIGTVYSVYSKAITGKTTIKTAAWVIKINNVDTTINNTFTIPSTNITIDNTNANAKTGVLAPGSTGTIDLVLDATGTEVPIDYSITLGNAYAFLNAQSSPIDLSSQISVTVASGSSLTGTILQNNSSMTQTIHLNFEWNKQDNSAANEIDLYSAGKNLLIPISVTTSQHITSN